MPTFGKCGTPMALCQRQVRLRPTAGRAGSHRLQLGSMETASTGSWLRLLPGHRCRRSLDRESSRNQTDVASRHRRGAATETPGDLNRGLAGEARRAAYDRRYRLSRHGLGRTGNSRRVSVASSPRRIRHPRISRLNSCRDGPTVSLDKKSTVPSSGPIGVWPERHVSQLNDRRYRDSRGVDWAELEILGGYPLHLLRDAFAAPGFRDSTLAATVRSSRSTKNRLSRLPVHKKSTVPSSGPVFRPPVPCRDGQTVRRLARQKIDCPVFKTVPSLRLGRKPDRAGRRWPDLRLELSPVVDGLWRFVRSNRRLR